MLCVDTVPLPDWSSDGWFKTEKALGVAGI